MTAQCWQADRVGGKILSNTCILVVVGFYPFISKILNYDINLIETMIELYL